MSDDALFAVLGDGRVRASALTRGPWDPGAQHGGAAAAILARAIEAAQPGAEMRVARVTYELVRPVPVGELGVEAEVVRPGRRVQLVRARLRADDGAVVAQAMALRVRRAPGGSPAVGLDDAGAPPLPLPGPEAIRRFHPPDGGPSFAGAGMELRFARGEFFEPGPALVWMSLRAPVVAGEAPSPLQRTVAAADFASGVGSVLDWGRWVFINPDLTVHLERDAVGEWIVVEADTVIAPDGSGQTTSTLYDERGRIGRSVQALFVDAR